MSTGTQGSRTSLLRQTNLSILDRVQLPTEHRGSSTINGRFSTAWSPACGEAADGPNQVSRRRTRTTTATTPWRGRRSRLDCGRNNRF